MFNKKAFTLIEILLVIAIIGILAAAVFAMIGNSDKTKLTAAQSTAKSILTYAQECYFNKSSLNLDADNENGGSETDFICDGSITIWPELSVSECSYASVADGTYTVDCGDIGSIVCDAQTGACTQN